MVEIKHLNLRVYDNHIINIVKIIWYHKEILRNNMNARKKER